MTKPKFTSLSQAVVAYYEELRNFVWKRTGSHSMAEEVVQETWIRASTKTVVLPENPRAYLYRMASNIVVDDIRRQQARKDIECLNDEFHTEELATYAEHYTSPAPELVEVVISQKEMASLNSAVEELPEKCRQVFLLYRGHGLSMREIALRLSVSEKTIEKHIARAMVHCRVRLREAGREVLCRITYYMLTHHD